MIAEMLANGKGRIEGPCNAPTFESAVHCLVL